MLVWEYQRKSALSAHKLNSETKKSDDNLALIYIGTIIFKTWQLEQW